MESTSRSPTAAASAPLPRRFCTHHANRPAIGVCVMLGTPICSECSTRYEGVNYSKEGLRLLHERRAAATGAKGSLGHRSIAILGWCVTPILLYLLYLSYAESATALLMLLHQAP